MYVLNLLNNAFLRYMKNPLLIHVVAYSESKLTFHFVVLVVVVVLVLLLRRKVEKDGNAKKVPFTNATVFQLSIHIDHDTYYRC